MKRVIIGMICLCAIVVTTAKADLTSSDIAKSLKKNLKHPYLYFTEKEKPALLERIKNDPECHDIMERLLAEANRLMYTPVEIPLPQQLRDSRFDTSGKFLGVYGSYRRAAYNLAFVYQMTGEEKYARKSFEFAEALCDMDTWVMRACQFPKAYFRVSARGARKDKVVFTYAIVASSTAANLAAVYDWLYPALDSVERDRIRGALLEKAIIQVRGNWEYHWWATAYNCNWCTWCNNGLGLAALTLLTEDPNLTDVVAEAYNRVVKTYDEIGIDGGWREGAGYGFHTVNVALPFADALKRITNRKFNIFKHPKLETFANFPLYISAPFNKSANFGDSGRGRFRNETMSGKLALETGNNLWAWINKNWSGTRGDIFDIIWAKHNVEPLLPAKTSHHFRKIGWVSMRSDFSDPEKVTVICKAGKNDDTHHGHLDVGQFMVYWRGVDYICDHGAATYDEKYFDPEKYDTPQASSRGHNLIFVNGEQQISGSHFHKPIDESIGGEVLEFRPGKDRDYILMDPTNAYPKKELKKWRRHIILEKPLITVVVDEVESKKGAEIEARFHSKCEQIVKDGYTLLDGEDGDMAVIPIVDGDFTFRPAKHAYQALQKQASFKWIPYNGTVVHASDDRTVIAHIILPVTDDNEARDIVKSATRTIDHSGNLSLSFTKDGTSYTYNFSRKKEGLILNKQ